MQIVAVFAILLIALAAVGIGIAMAAVVAGAIALLISAGIFSSPVAIGFKTGSISKGVRLALFQICAAMGAVTGLGIAAGMKIFGDVKIGWMPIESIGFFTGTATRMVVGASVSEVVKFILQKSRPKRGFEVA